jgi:alkylresorcinol/alkylpyrone synthase
LTAPAVTGRLAGIGTAVPSDRVSIEEIWQSLRALRGGHLPRGAQPGRDHHRHLAAPLEWILQPHTQGDRTDAYLRHARGLARGAAAEAIQRSGTEPGQIGLIISVSCTGFVLPSLDAELIPQLGLADDTTRLPITELGCGGGVAALGRAHDYLRAYPDRAVLVVAVELPSLTFQPEDRSIDNLVAALIFGDGAGSALLDASAGAGWHVTRTASVLIPEGARHLGYELRDGGLKVILSRQLPDVIARHLPRVVDRFLAQDGLRVRDLDQVVAHPGGPRVLDAVAGSLGLPSHRLETSEQVFARVGNVSSATIFFVLDALPIPFGPSTALAIAFGPGLSIELALLRFES